jgi:hypothetical protein
MTTGHRTDSLTEAWEREPDDLIKGFLRVRFPDAEGTRHAYDNPNAFVLARMVERVTGRGLPELLDERLFTPMGIRHAEWDRVASGAAFGFHGLHLTTEAVAAFGELLLREGRWGDRQLVPAGWVRLATSRHVGTQLQEDWSPNPDAMCGYGYQFWMSQHGYRGDGAFGQQCLVVPALDLVVAFTGAVTQDGSMPGVVWDCLLPGIDAPAGARDDEVLAERLRGLSLPRVSGTAGPDRGGTARIDASAPDSALPDRTEVAVEPVAGGWRVRLGPAGTLAVGHGEWRESAPLGRPVVAAGAWQGDTFVADLCVVTTPHRVRLVVDGGTAVATWHTVPLTGPRLELHLRSPLRTRPDVS